jgi:hypothetical protein
MVVCLVAVVRWLGRTVDLNPYKLVVSLSTGQLNRWRVDKAVGNGRNEGPELTAPVADSLFAG